MTSSFCCCLNNYIFTMIQLNVSFGIYAFLPQGWMFMIAIILIECFGLSYLLTKQWKDLKIFKTVIISNIISGAIGIIGSMMLTGGWWLIIWFPWVSDNEVSGSEGFIGLSILYAIAFILTIIIERFVNHFRLKKDYSKSQIYKMTLFMNIISYTFGTLAMYSYSF